MTRESMGPLRLLLAIGLITTVGCAYFSACLIFGFCAAVGYMVLTWGPEFCTGPPPGAIPFVCFMTITIIGMMTAAISSYVVLILPLAIRRNDWGLVAYNIGDRLFAYYADGLTRLMKRRRSDQSKKQIPEI